MEHGTTPKNISKQEIWYTRIIFILNLKELKFFTVIDGVVRGKKTEEHKAAVIGDTVGDPLKDTSGPSLNILVKLSAILSLVFANVFCETGFLVNAFGVYEQWFHIYI